ncbi:MAG: glycosyltransferase family 4 protein [Desulfatirhabdiaceae bacterium]
MKIVQMGPTRWQGGVAVAIQQTCIDLAKLGHQVLLIGNGGPVTDSITKQGIRCQEVNWSVHPGVLPRTVWQVHRQIRAFHPDVIHVHGRAPSLVCHLSGYRPDWFTLHNVHLTEKAGPLDLGPIRKYLSPLAKNLFVLNEEAADYATRHLDVKPQRMVILPNGVDCSYFRPPTPDERNDARRLFQVEPHELLTLFVGRFHEQKNPLALLDLAEALLKRFGLSIKMAIVGTGPMENEIRNRIQMAGLSESCRMYGWMDPRTAYFAADLLLMPSQYEGFGLVAAEAQACGCPVLRTRTGGWDVTLQNGISGMVCQNTSIDFVHRGLELLADCSRLHAMRPAAREWAMNTLSIRNQTLRMVLAYRHERQE